MKKIKELTGNARFPGIIKVFMIMKLTAFLILISIFSVLANKTYSQSKMIDLRMEKVTVREVLSKIENQSDFRFMYSGKIIDADRVVSINVKNAKIDEVLKSLFSETEVDYTLKNRLIVLTLPMYSDNSANQQHKSVKGKVTDSSGTFLPGVTVIIKGTTQGTVTDSNGNFSLTSVPENAVLQFSFLGMKNQEIPIAGKTSINATMDEETIGIDEVVAIGYGTIRKVDLTGAVTTVSAKDFDKIPASTALQALQGRAAGVQITTNSGMPGAGADVQIRGIQSINGTSSPIFVVDGVITNGINNLNPNSIESISILKDASAAAIYGARAANGVILVTTKRGEGKKDIEIALNAYTGIQTESNLKLKLLDANQWLDLYTESYENAKIDRPWSDEILSHYTGVNTDWKSLMMQTGVIQNYDLSVSGGSEKSNYYVSASFQDHKGMVIATNFDKYTFTFNTDHKINDWIKFGNSMNIYSTINEGTVAKGGLIQEPYTIALRKSPVTRAYEDDGDYGHIFDMALEHNHANPVWMAKETFNEIKEKGLQGSLYLTLSPLKGLEFTARGSMDYGTRYTSYFRPGVPGYYGWEGTNVNTVEKQHTETTHWISDFLANYSTSLNEIHDFKVLLGYSLEESKTETLYGRRTGTPSNELRYLFSGDPATQINDNRFYDWAFASMFGRLNYTFKDKYLLTATIRRDGTSRLFGDNKFGIFPSASLAWRISEEGFLSGVDFIDDLKLRVSYGTLGNILSVGNYATTAALSARNSAMDSQPAQGFTLTTATNTNLKWEEAAKKDIGIDATLFDNKLYTTVDYFVEDTYDLLFGNPIPWSSGLAGSPLINAGQVRNTGYEGIIGYRSKKSDWSYDVSFNFSHVENKVMDLEGRDLRTSGIEEGYPVSSYFGYKSDGLIRDASQLDIYKTGSYKNKQIGDIYLLDIDGYDAEGKLTGIPDGKVDAADRTIIGKRYPDFYYGALGTFSYKNWSFQVQVQGVQGIDKNFISSDAVQLMASWARNEDARVLNRYHPTKNPNGTWPRLSKSNTGGNDTFSEFWLEDASYMRIKNVNLNYNLPKTYCSKLRMRELGLYVSVQNAYTFTRYGGPEVDTTSDPLTGIPQPRTWTLGLKATF